MTLSNISREQKSPGPEPGYVSSVPVFGNPNRANEPQAADMFNALAKP
jgi:hypothetical protein